MLWGVQVTGPLNVAARDVNNYYYRVESSNETSCVPPILDSIPNFRAIQIATLSRATPGTGLWIVDYDNFRLWLDPDGWIRIMWGDGIPGAGKTVAASIVINALEAHASQSTLPVCVCYIYFRYSDHTKATTRSFLEVLVKQTLERHPGCLPLFNETYTRHIREKTRPSEGELLGLLRRFTGAMVTFYVLDALDEAPPEVQLEIIERLTSLNAKLFITSRPLRNVEAAFPNVHRFVIVAQASDVALHIDKEISRSGDLRAILERGGPSLRDEIHDSIKTKCGGMFLHVSLQLAALRKCTSVHEVEQALAAFPTGIEGMYLQTWQRILDQAPNKVFLVKKVLLWVLHATRSLTVRMLEQAIATCPDTYKYQSSRLVPVDTLVGLCRGLVTVEKGTDLVRLVHYTAEDSLKHLVAETFPFPHALLSAVCTTRLTDSGFQRTTLINYWQLQHALQAEPLLSYAYDSWSSHAQKSLASDPLNRCRLMEFVENCHAYPVFRRYCYDVLGPLHLVALFNLPIAFAGSMNLRNPNQITEMTGETALHLACVQGHDNAVKELLYLPNILVNMVDVEGATALIMASRSGYEGVTRLLLDRPDVNVNVPDRWWKTAFISAFDEGHKGIVALIISHPDIDVNVVDYYKDTPLIRASEYGEEDMLAVLLSHPDVNVNAVNWRGRAALNEAAAKGSVGNVKLLLSHPHANIDLVDKDGDTPLSLAVKGKWGDLVEFLLAHPSIKVGTRELEIARGKGCHRIVSMLEEFLNPS
ncbi:ankyrin repeat-containing domain protein [Coprinopsis sp. MPI-PUGE-AT-0042]|nr:ankyrin repeat-containing domain protein [Coprinopsis sp. MPI-PUGE-AT-0042]